MYPAIEELRNNSHISKTIKYDKYKIFGAPSFSGSPKYRAIPEAQRAWESYDQQPHARLEYDLLEIEISITDKDRILFSTPTKKNWRRLLKLIGTPFEHIVGVQVEGIPTTGVLDYAKAMARYLIPIAASYF